MDYFKPILAGAAEHRNRTGAPFVTLSYAQSLDGCISARPGETLALSGSESLKLTHKLRAWHDAILVGIGTVLSDDPRLNVRLVNGSNPRPIVVDSTLRLPLDCRLLTHGAMNPWIVTREEPDKKRVKALEEAGATVIALPADSNGKVSLSAMLRMLAQQEINSLMVEGGSRIITSFLMERLANLLVITVAPVMVGGLRAVKDLGETTDPGQFRRLADFGYRWLGSDLIIWGKLAQGEVG